MSGMQWTKERDQLVINLAKGGLSASQIAAQLGVTRNAVIGRLARIGGNFLRKTVLPMGGTEQPGQRANNQAEMKRSHDKRKPPMTLPPVPPIAAEIPPEEIKSPVVVVHHARHDEKPTLRTLRAFGECKYPTWGDHERPPIDERFFCGEKTLQTGPYCAEHAQLCYTPVPSRSGRPFIAARNERL